ncbi:MAG: 6-phosphogluconolactonase [Chthoniobacteraceae bacterium]
MFHHTICFDDFAAGAAQFILEKGKIAISERGLFRLGLAGGNTPRPIHEAMAAQGADFPWDKVQITFGDERCVPPDDKDSNYAMAKASLLDRVPIPEGNVFRMRGEIDPEAAATEYERKLSAVAQRFGEAKYRHDLLLLGLGPDGHTASLFPGLAALGVTDRDAIPVIGPKPPPQRITLTFPLIKASREIAFLVKESAKADVVREVQFGDARHPASRVGSATWLLSFPL